MPRPHQNLLVLSIFCASCVIVFIHLFVFPLYDSFPKKKSMKYLGDYEQTLCGIYLKVPQKPETEHCPKDGIVTVAQGGRLGNQMWEYASVWAVARRTGLEPYVPRCIRKVLDKVFENLSIAPLGYVGHCLANWDNIVPSPEIWTYTNQSIVLPRFSIFPELVLTWVDDIRMEFTFKKVLVDVSQNILKTASQLMNSNISAYVGVHVRRTDYRQYLWRTHRVRLADAGYFHNAMDYFRNKFPGTVVFLVVSDDPKWCHQNLVSDKNDVFVVSKTGISSAGQDLAVMAACNHTIIDYGTFGVWGAILASGETIVYNISKHSSIRVSELLPNWHVMN